MDVGDRVPLYGRREIKRRSTAGTEATPVQFSAALSFTRTPYKPAVRDYQSRAARPVQGLTSPIISPDGNQVAFVALGDVWVMPIGGAARRVTNDRFVEVDLTWSPDGRSLAYSSDRDGTMDLWVRDIAAGTDRKAAAEATRASWAPRGSEIAYINRDGALAITGRPSQSSRGPSRPAAPLGPRRASSPSRRSSRTRPGFAKAPTS